MVVFYVEGEGRQYVMERMELFLNVSELLLASSKREIKERLNNNWYLMVDLFSIGGPTNLKAKLRFVSSNHCASKRFFGPYT